MEFSIPVTLSIPDLLLLAILVLTILIGMKRGFVAMISGLAAFAGALFCADRFAFVLDGILERHIFRPWTASLVGKALERAADVSEDSLETCFHTITETAKNLGISFEGLEMPSVDGILNDAAAAEIAGPLAEKLSYVTAQLVLFLLVYLLLRLAFWGIALLFRLPLLREVNSVLGFCVGLLLGCAYAWAGAQLLHIIIGVWCASGTLPALMEPGLIMKLLTGSLA